MKIVVLRANEVVDRVAAYPRRLPDGSVGAEYLGLVYPLRGGNKIDADGPWYYPAKAPIFLDPPDQSIVGATSFWQLEVAGARPYVFLDGDEPLVIEALKRLRAAGFTPEHWGPSFRESPDGRLFDWFIRMPHEERAKPPSRWEIDQAFLTLPSYVNGHGERERPSSDKSVVSLGRDIVHLSERIVSLERELAAEIRRADGNEARAIELKINFDREIKRANESALFLRAALAKAKEVQPKTTTPVQTFPHGDSAATGQLQHDLEVTLDQWLASEEALQRSAEDLAVARARISELESREVGLPSFGPESARARARTRRTTKAINLVLSIFAPSIFLLRESDQFIDIEVPDRTDLYEKFRTLDQNPKDLKCKRVQSAEGWLELHFSTGLGRDGRIYFKKMEIDGHSRWGVLVSDKAAQPRDFDWMSRQ